MKSFGSPSLPRLRTHPAPLPEVRAAAHCIVAVPAVGCSSASHFSQLIKTFSFYPPLQWILILVFSVSRLSTSHQLVLLQSSTKVLAGFNWSGKRYFPAQKVYFPCWKQGGYWDFWRRGYQILFSHYKAMFFFLAFILEIIEQFWLMSGKKKKILRYGSNVECFSSNN